MNIISMVLTIVFMQTIGGPKFILCNRPSDSFVIVFLSGHIRLSRETHFDE